MTIEEAMVGYLVGKGMSRSDALVVFGTVTVDPANAAMMGRWNDAIENYSQSLLAVLRFSARRAALGWVDRNCPQAWYRPMLTDNPEAELTRLQAKAVPSAKKGGAEMSDFSGQVMRAGALDMQVCVQASWTDEQVVEFANAKNPCGTTHGWAIRKDTKLLAGAAERNPCEKDISKVHITLDALQLLPEYRAIAHERAKAKGMYVLTEEPAEGDLRVEHYESAEGNGSVKDVKLEGAQPKEKRTRKAVQR